MSPSDSQTDRGAAVAAQWDPTPQSEEARADACVEGSEERRPRWGERATVTRVSLCSTHVTRPREAKPRRREAAAVAGGGGAGGGQRQTPRSVWGRALAPQLDGVVDAAVL